MDSRSTLAARSARLLDDPPALRDAWRRLRESHHHLHGPEAAAMLGVPEAALLASRVGDGALPMAVDLTGILAGCDRWGKLLFAARNAMGVAIVILDDARLGDDGPTLVLRSPCVDARIDPAAAASVYLFEDTDAHGHSLSLNWFDGRGDAVGRLYLMSKSGREEAHPHLQRFARPEPAPRWRARASSEPAAPMRLGATREPRAALAGIAPATLGERAILARDAAPAWRVVLEGPGAALRYQGPLARSMHTPPAVHATDARCKLHLRMQAAASVWHCATDDGLAALRWEDRDGGALTLAPVVDPAASARWLDALTRGGGQ